MKTLIIESDRSLAQSIELLLSSYGCAVDIAPNGDAALQMVDAEEYDRILLDNICLYQHLRARGCQSQILLLIPPGEEWQKAIAINAGINDYLVQPFESEELLARWQSLPENQVTAPSILTWGCLTLDPSQQQVSCDNRSVKLTALEYGILELLARSPHQPTSAKTIASHLPTSLAAIRKGIRALSHKLTTAGAPTDAIAAKRGLGYQLNPLYASRSGDLQLTAETALRESKARQAFLLKLSDGLRPLADPVEIQETVALASQVADLIEGAPIHEEIESDLRNTQLLHALATQLVTENDIQSFYEEILTAAIALMGADAGTVQILDRASGELVMQAHRGFEPHTIEHFHRVSASSHTSYGRALATGDRAFIDFDVPESEDPEGSLRLHVEAGYLSAQSTPLISRAGEQIGMVSTHWRQHHRPSDRQLRFLDLLARQAADAIEQRQTAAALQEREELLRTMTQAGLWTWDVATGKLNWSPEVYRLHGIDPAREQIDYDRWFYGCLHPEDRPRVTAYLGQIIEQRPSEFQLEHRALHPQHGFRWLLSIAQPFWSDRGELLRLSGVLIDITDRKQSEIALQESEAQLSQVLNSAVAVIAQFRVFSDRTWKYDYFSNGCEILHGYTPAQLVADQMLWISRVFPEDRENLILPCLDRFFTGASFRLEYRFYHRDGSLRWLSSIFTSRQIAPDCWQVTAVDQDITERKLAELARQDSEAKFRHFAENSHALIWIAEPIALKPIYVSPAYERIWGRSARYLIERPESWMDAIHLDDRDLVRSTLLEQRQQPSSKLEYRVVRPDGSIRWIRDWGFQIRNEAGEVYGYGGIAEDITEGKIAEIALKQSEARFAAAFNYAAIGMALSDLEGKFLQVNQALCHITGYSEAELLEMHFGTITHPDDLKADLEYARQLLAGESRFHHIEKRYLHKQGHYVWILLSGSLVRDGEGQPLHFIGQIQDINERKLAENALRASEARFAAAFNRAAIGTALIDCQGVFLQVNPALCELLGYSEAELIGTHFAAITHPDDLENCLHQIARLVAGEIGFYQLEKRYLHKRGRVVWALASGAMVRSEQGEHLYAIAQVQDISDRKLAEQKVREQAALLDVASDAIFVRDLNNRILYWNRGAERLYGWTAAEAIGQNVSELLQQGEQKLEDIGQKISQLGEWRG